MRGVQVPPAEMHGNFPADKMIQYSIVKKVLDMNNINRLMVFYGDNKVSKAQVADCT